MEDLLSEVEEKALVHVCALGRRHSDPVCRTGALTIIGALESATIQTALVARGTVADQFERMRAKALQLAAEDDRDELLSLPFSREEGDVLSAALARFPVAAGSPRRALELAMNLSPKVMGPTP